MVRRCTCPSVHFFVSRSRSVVDCALGFVWYVWCEGGVCVCMCMCMLCVVCMCVLTWLCACDVCCGVYVVLWCCVFCWWCVVWCGLACVSLCLSPCGFVWCVCGVPCVRSSTPLVAVDALAVVAMTVQTRKTTSVISKKVPRENFPLRF